MALLPWCPRFVVDTALFDFSYPVSRWIPGARTTGSTRKDATRNPGNEIQLRRYTIGMNLRFVDTDWPMVKNLIQIMQRRSCTWYPRALMVVPDMPDSFIVDLDSPHVTDAVAPVRDSTYVRLLSLPIVLRSATNFHAYYFPVT